MTDNNSGNRKIGILTFHRAQSYGAVLQCYALLEVLQKLYPDDRTGVIDFSPDRFCGDKSKKKKNTSEVLNRFLESHINFITPSSPTLHGCLKETGLTDIIVGSDQVWNPDILKDTLRDYYLCGIPDGIRKHSYAASFGVAEWNGDPAATDVVKTALQQFTGISVREASAVNICGSLGRKDAVNVIDPTLLAGREIFDPIAEKGTLTGSIAGYFLSSKPEQIKILKSVARAKQKKNSQILLLNRKAPFLSFIKASVHTEMADFLHGIRHADFVVTDSFHGVCFAILFEKEFAVLPSKRKDRFTRIAELLELTGLTDRVIHDETSDLDRILKTPVDFAKVGERLALSRSKSLDFLKKL